MEATGRRACSGQRSRLEGLLGGEDGREQLLGAGVEAVAPHRHRGAVGEVGGDDGLGPRRRPAVAVEIESASAKVRTGMPADEPEDLELPTWAGVIPIRQIFEDPIPDEFTPADMAVPGYLRDLVNRNR